MNCRHFIAGLWQRRCLAMVARGQQPALPTDRVSAAPTRKSETAEMLSLCFARARGDTAMSRAERADPVSLGGGHRTASIDCGRFSIAERWR